MLNMARRHPVLLMLKQKMVEINTADMYLTKLTIGK